MLSQEQRGCKKRSDWCPVCRQESEAELAYTGSLTHHSACISSVAQAQQSVLGSGRPHLVLRRNMQHCVQTVGKRRVAVSAICRCAVGHLVLQQAWQSMLTWVQDGDAIS